jgi:hypothetical protein
LTNYIQPNSSSNIEIAPVNKAQAAFAAGSYSMQQISNFG